MLNTVLNAVEARRGIESIEKTAGTSSWLLKNDPMKSSGQPPMEKYTDHKHRAKQSGVEFKLTYEEWWEIWEPHWEGRGLGGLVMCRYGDNGAYEVGNVRIDTQANNNREAHGCL